MKILLTWLEEFVDLGGRSSRQIADDLENLGHEVEHITTLGLPETVVVGHVTAVAPHPNADRLRVTTVDTGAAVRTIVCAAPNLAVGQTVVVALPGTTLPNDLVIERRAIRGVTSDGVICAPDELGMSGDRAGILVLGEGYQVGQPYRTVAADAVLDVALTANRGDCLSYLGISRELGALWEQQIKRQLANYLPAGSQRVRVRVDDPDLCPLYTARLVSHLTAGALPEAITQRLAAVGHGRYHPVVDLTNYVMEELGVPLHAFDARKVNGDLVIRTARGGESIILLDGSELNLIKTMLVIADDDGPLALGGIMGGARAAVTDATSSIILEAAYFDPGSVRRTRRALDLQTSASHRFERGTDPLMAARANDYATQLLAEHCDGQGHPLVTVGTPPERPVIVHDDLVHAMNRHLGSELSQNDIEDVLDDLGFTYHTTPDSPAYQVTVPSWRHDVAIVQDLAEEVARMKGYDSLHRTRLPEASVSVNPDDVRWRQIEQAKDVLAAEGWTEQIGSSFLSEREVVLLGIASGALIKLHNPVSEEAAYLRTTQLLSLLKVIAKNPIFPDLRVFEIGTVWKPAAEQSGGEQTALSLVWTGTQAIRLPFVPDRTFGTPVDPELLKKLKIRRPVMFSEVPVELVTAAITQADPVLMPPVRATFRPPSRFQPTLRDIAILVDQAVNPDDVAAELHKIDHVVDVELFDQFTGGKLPAGKQSLAFHLLLEHAEKSLTNVEIQLTMEQLSALLKNKFDASLR